MIFKDKRSTITSMKLRSRPSGEEGLASIVVVSVLIVIMALVSLGFARIINRSASNAANRQFSASATYAAQAGINEVASYLKRYVQLNPTNGYLPKSTKCTGPGSLIGDSTTHGPFYDKSNLASDSSTKYTCILLNPTPTSLHYTTAATKSQIVKVNTSAAAGALDKLMISWQPTDTNPADNINGYPTSFGNLYDQTTWNSTSDKCKDSSNVPAPCLPILRLSIYPVSNGELLSSVQAQSKTVFLYPQSPSGTIPVKSYTDPAFKDGSLIPVPCTQSVSPLSFNLSSPPDYKCNIIINSLAGAISPANTDSVYLRLTSIYNQSDYEITANDKFGSVLDFLNDQAVVDVTAQTGGVSKRLQAYVDTSSLSNTTTNTDTNISSSSDAIPEESIRSANALCKRIIQTTPTVTHSPFINFDDPDSVCHHDDIVTNPVPELTFSITGRDWNGTGYPNRTRDSEEETPGGSGLYGTIYTQAGSNFSLDWTTKNATSCTATLGTGSDGWAGEKNGLMTFTGSPAVNGQGSQSMTVPSGVTEYDLQCSRPLAPSPTALKKVKVWPEPRITNLSVNPSTIHAGEPYTVSWASINAKPNGCVLSGDWPDTTRTDNSFSETVNWTAAETRDPNYSKSFSVKCIDPVGRYDTKTVQVNNTGVCSAADCPPPGGGSSGQGVPPDCSASVSYSGTDSTNSAVNWTTACDYWDNANTWWTSRHIEYTKDGASQWSSDVSCGWMGCSGSFDIRSTGTYCFDIYVWADNWKSKTDAASYGSTSGAGEANSGNVCKTVAPPPVVVQDSAVSGYYFPTWKGDGGTCRDSTLSHAYIVCFSWNVWQDDGIHYDVPGTGVAFPPNACKAVANSSVYGSGSTFGSPHYARGTYGSPNVDNYWNVTFGYDSNPGNVSVNVTCTSPVYGNSGSGNSDPLQFSSYACTPSTACGGGGSGGGSGGGGSGGGGSGGGGGGSGGGGGGGGGCFVAGTEILTPQGQKPIEQLKVGDLVETWDTAQKKLVEAPIIFTYSLDNKPTFWLVTDAGSITTTSTHPFWTGNRWLQAADLKPGMQVMSADGRYHKVLFSMQGADQKVYNLEVGNANHDFFANNILVHNILSL